MASNKATHYCTKCMKYCTSARHPNCSYEASPIHVTKLPILPEHGTYQPQPTPLRTMLMPDSVSEAHVLIAMGQAYLESVGYTGPSPTKVSITLPEAQVKVPLCDWEMMYRDLCKAINMYMHSTQVDRDAEGYQFILDSLCRIGDNDEK